MSAGEEAVPLWQENPEWKKNFENKKFICNTCGHVDFGYNLLCEPDIDVLLYCPNCRIANWEWM